MHTHTSHMHTYTLDMLSECHCMTASLPCPPDPQVFLPMEWVYALLFKACERMDSPSLGLHFWAGEPWLSM